MVSGLGFGGFSFGVRAYGLSQRAIGDSIERLATGNRINRASDDPSGLQALTKFEADIRRLEADIDGRTQENYWLAAREGGLGAISDLVIGLQGAVVGAANTGGRSKEEIDALQLEVDGILDGIELVLQTHKFKGESLFSETLASFGTVSGDAEEGDGDELLYSLAALRSGGAMSLTGRDLDKAQDLVGGAVKLIALRRATIGAKINQNESLIRAKGVELEELSGIASAVRDTDYAAETANLVRLQVLEQAQLASIQIGRQNATSVLALIQSAVPTL